MYLYKSLNHVPIPALKQLQMLYRFPHFHRGLEMMSDESMFHLKKRKITKNVIVSYLI